MIRTILSLLFYGLIMAFLGFWIALHTTEFITWLGGRSEWAGHVIRKECKTPNGWYSCDKLAPVSPTPAPQL